MSDKFRVIREKTAAKRVRTNKIVNYVSIFFAVLGLFFLVWIMVTLIVKGIAGFSSSIFIDDTVFGGLRNALIGHTILVGIA